jgi:DNA-binding NarL/FixJ family response regulator
MPNSSTLETEPSVQLGANCAEGLGRPNTSFSIVLVDDHEIVRDGIRSVLSRCEDFDVVGEAGNGPDAIHLCTVLQPNLVLMDIGLPGLNGLESTREIMRCCPDCRVVVLSMYDDAASVVAAIESGAIAFLLKKASAVDLVEALRAVAQHGSYFSPFVTGRLMDRIQSRDEVEDKTPLIEGLSPREAQVMRLVTEGNSSRQIGAMLNLSEQTVRTYRKTMMKKLDVTNAPDLTRLAISAGIVSLSPADPGRRPSAPSGTQFKHDSQTNSTAA